MTIESKPNDPQLEVFMEAFEVYHDRQVRYGDQVWQASGWRGMLVDMRKKLDRLWAEYYNLDNSGDVNPEKYNLDSAIDLINFTAFFIRQVRENDRDGEWPWDV